MIFAKAEAQTGQEILKARYANKKVISEEILKKNFCEIWQILGKGEIDFEIGITGMEYDSWAYAFKRKLYLKGEKAYHFEITFNAYTGELLELQDWGIKKKEKINLTQDKTIKIAEIFLKNLYKFINFKNYTKKEFYSGSTNEIWFFEEKDNYKYINNYIFIEISDCGSIVDYRKINSSDPCKETKIKILKSVALNIAWKFKRNIEETAGYDEYLKYENTMPLYIINLKGDDIHESRLAFQIQFKNYTIPRFSLQGPDSVCVWINAEDGQIIKYFENNLK